MWFEDMTMTVLLMTGWMGSRRAAMRLGGGSIVLHPVATCGLDGLDAGGSRGREPGVRIGAGVSVGGERP